MHERNQRRLCRAAFVVLCALPTISFLAWILVFQVTGHISQHQRLLSDRLGCRVSIQKVRYSKPGVTVLEGLKLADRETGEQFAYLPLLELTQAGKSLSLRIDSIEINSSELNRFPLWIDREILQNWNQSEISLKFDVAKVDVHYVKDIQSFSNLTGTIKAIENGPQATLDFFVDGYEMPQSAQLWITRDLSKPLPETLYEFHTGGAPLPCRKIFPHSFRKNQQVSKNLFQGLVRISQTQQGWQGEIEPGSILLVDLRELSESWSTRKITGQGRVTIEIAKFQSSRFQELKGTFKAGPGQVDPQLLLESERQLFTKNKSPLSYRHQEIQYSELALDLHIDGSGVVLRGRCDLPEQGVILKDTTGPLLTEPAQSVSVGAVTSTLVNEVGRSGLASPMSQAILSILPLPNLRHTDGPIYRIANPQASMEVNSQED